MFWPLTTAYKTQLTKAYKAETSCNHVVIDFAMYVIQDQFVYINNAYKYFNMQNNCQTTNVSPVNQLTSSL